MIPLTKLRFLPLRQFWHNGSVSAAVPNSPSLPGRQPILVTAPLFTIQVASYTSTQRGSIKLITSAASIAGA